MPPTPAATQEKAAVAAQAQAESDKEQVKQEVEAQNNEPFDLTVACRDDECVTLLLKGVPIPDEKGVPTGQYISRPISFLNGQTVSSADLHPSVLQLYLHEDAGVKSVVYREGQEDRPYTTTGPRVLDTADVNPQVEQAERARAARQSQGGRAG